METGWLQRLGAATALVLGVACGGGTPTVDAGPRDVPRVDGTACVAGGVTQRFDQRYMEVPAGVDANLLSLDLYLPNLPAGCAPPPLVVYVHGGAWVVGDKRAQIETKVRYFTGEGYAFASVNYRLSPSAAQPAGVRHPTHVEDVAAALAWLRANAAAQGYRAERITLFGHSAGAGIVALLGTDGQFLAARGRALGDLSCVAALDTEAYDVRENATGDDMLGRVYRNAFGDDPAVWDRASPLRNGTLVAGRGIPRFLVVTRGTAPRQAMNQRFGQALRSAGVEASVVVATGLDHEGVNDAIGLASDTTVMPTFAPFVRACTAP